MNYALFGNSSILDSNIEYVLNVKYIYIYILLLVSVLSLFN
jgi:hypothetical protein